MFHNYTYNIYGFNLKKINVVTLGILTILFIISIKDEIKKNFKILFVYFTLIFILTIGIRSLYLSFFILGISIFIKKDLAVKYFLQISSFFYMLTIFLYKIGYLLEVENPLLRFERVRYSLGFAHPNTAMMFLFPIFSLIYYLYFSKYKKNIIIFIISTSLVIFFLTFSRTTFIVMISFIGLVLLNDKIIEKLQKLFLLEGVIIVLFTLVFSFIFNGWNNTFNKLLSGRFSLFYEYLTKCKITIFGNMEVLNKYNLLPLDNSFLRILFENGLIGFALLLVINFITIKFLLKNRDYKAVRIYSLLLILGFMEGGVFHFYFNVLCFMFYNALPH